MLELGRDSAAEHRQILDLALQLGFNDVILVGKEFSKAGGQRFSYRFPSRNEAMSFFTENPTKGHFILIKGSRGIGLEKLLEVL